MENKTNIKCFDCGEGNLYYSVFDPDNSIIYEYVCQLCGAKHEVFKGNIGFNFLYTYRDGKIVGY